MMSNKKFKEVIATVTSTEIEAMMERLNSIKKSYYSREQIAAMVALEKMGRSYRLI